MTTSKKNIIIIGMMSCVLLLFWFVIGKYYSDKKIYESEYGFYVDKHNFNI